jgi:TM2 domain-containing membrane protein YozV
MSLDKVRKRCYSCLSKIMSQILHKMDTIVVQLVTRECQHSGRQHMQRVFTMTESNLTSQNHLDSKNMPHKQRALFLCLLLGLFGAHRFYLHQNTTGLAYLIFSWTLIPAFLSLIDAIFLAQMSEEEFREEYCHVAAK